MISQLIQGLTSDRRNSNPMENPMSAFDTTNAAVISQDGTAIAYSSTGDGPALIYVHGATQFRAISDASMKFPQLLSDRFNVLTYDRRGRGESGDTKPYAPEREYEDLAALIQACGGGSCVFGESSGAILALEAARAGVDIRAIVCYEPPFRIDGSMAPVASDVLDRFNAFIDAGDRAAAFTLFMVECVGLPADMAAGVIDQPFWPAFESVVPTIAYDLQVTGAGQAGDPAWLQRYASVKTPVHVVTGGDSEAYMQFGADALVDVLPNAVRVTLPGLTHQYDPDTVAPVLRHAFGGA
jgi:pimeloyl-ACP methyl ester carboxylesterase